jgi:hypothetical protein
VWNPLSSPIIFSVTSLNALFSEILMVGVKANNKLLCSLPFSPTCAPAIFKQNKNNYPCFQIASVVTISTVFLLSYFSRLLLLTAKLGQMVKFTSEREVGGSSQKHIKLFPTWQPMTEALYHIFEVTIDASSQCRFRTTLTDGSARETESLDVILT